MSEFILFIQHHPLMFSAWVAVIVVIVIYELYMALTAARLTTPQLVIDLMNHHDAVMIDLRAQKVFNQGHVAGAVNIPADMLKTQTNKLSHYSDRIVILTCANGMESKRIANDLLKQHVLKKVRVLTGGIQAWIDAGLPLVK